MFVGRILFNDKGYSLRTSSVVKEKYSLFHLEDFTAVVLLIFIRNVLS